MIAMAQGRYVTRVEDGVDVGGIVRSTCLAIEMSLKEAALVMSWDFATFSRALSGQAPLDLWKLRRLPARFWREFIPKFVSAHISQWLKDLLKEAA